MDPRVHRIVALFEHLTPAELPRLAEIYTADARFKDPFNEVQGAAAITRIFAHMFGALEAPRFFIRDVVVQGDQCFLGWDFVFRLPRRRSEEQLIRGATHLQPCTATTGMRPRSCTRSCPSSAHSCAG